MEIEGQIEEIIYQNEVNSYTIAVLAMEEESITIVGYLPFITQGDYLKLFGKFVMHQEYGRQFKIDTFEKIMPKTLQGLEKYLAGGVIKGIGPSIAKKIIDKFGEETIAVFKFEPQKLATIKGISESRATEIAKEFNEKWELWQIVGFLERFGISPSNCKKVYDELGNDAIARIEENPYLLLDIAYGVDFKQVDKMAMDLGIANNHTKRIEGAIKYALLITSYNGHTCVEEQNLYRFVVDLLEVNKEEIEDGMINLKGKGEIVLEKREDSKWVYLTPFYQAEKNIAEKLLNLQNIKNTKKIHNFESKRNRQEEKLDIILSEKQKEAINAVNENNVCIITGGPRYRKNYYYKMYYRNV